MKVLKFYKTVIFSILNIKFNIIYNFHLNSESFNILFFLHIQLKFNFKYLSETRQNKIISRCILFLSEEVQVMENSINSISLLK